MVDQDKINQWLLEAQARVSKKSWGTYIEFTESELKTLIELAVEHGVQQAISRQDTQELVRASTKLADDLHDLIGNSEGVAGLHRNGEVANWESLMAGGQHEGWLGSLDEMDQVLANRLLNKTDPQGSAEQSPGSDDDQSEQCRQDAPGP